MSDKFTPLTFGTLPLRETASAASQSSAPPATVTVFRSLPGQAAEAVADACAKPAITLLRNAAGVVTSVLVQCSCGKATELNCVY